MHRFRLLLTIAFFIFIYSCSKSGGSPAPPAPPPPSSTDPTITSFAPQQGVIGSDVIVTGTNFSATSSEDLVKINGVDANVKTSSTTSLTVTIPTAATTGKITVTVNGKTATSSLNFAIVKAGTWNQKLDYGGEGRGDVSSFTIGGKGYVIFGYTASNKCATDFWEFDGSSNQWTKKADFPSSGRRRGFALTIGNKAYVGLGYNDHDLDHEHNDFWEYDPSLDQWTRKADFPGAAREDGIAFGFDTVGYIGLGTDETYVGFYKDFWKYNPATDQWTVQNDFPGAARLAPIAFSSGTIGYVISGGAPVTGSTNECWQFNATTNSWTQFPDFPGVARMNGAGFVINGKIYAGFGTPSLGYFGDFWQYDPDKNIWVQQADFPSDPKSGLAGFAIGNKGYIGLGYASSSIYQTKDFWEFTP